MVVVHGRLQEEGVLSLRVSHLLYAVRRLLDEHLRLGRAHERPHAAVDLDLRYLKNAKIYVIFFIILLALNHFTEFFRFFLLQFIFIYSLIFSLSLLFV